MWGGPFSFMGGQGPLVGGSGALGGVVPPTPTRGKCAWLIAVGEPLPQLGGPLGPQRWHLVGNALGGGLLAGCRPAAPVDPVGDA